MKRAIAGEETTVELVEPAGPMLEWLVDNGLLAHVVPLLVRGGRHPRILVLPRRRSGAPTVGEIFAADHARLDALLDRIEVQARERDVGVAGTVFAFAWSMRRHMWIEDHIVFPLYERSSGVPLSPHLGPMRVEHACIEHYTALLLRAAEDMAPHDRRESAVSDLLHVHCGLVGILAEHDAREEARLFPTIDHTVAFDRRLDVMRRIVAFDPDTPDAHAVERHA